MEGTKFFTSIVFLLFITSSTSFGQLTGISFGGSATNFG